MAHSVCVLEEVAESECKGIIFQGQFDNFFHCGSGVKIFFGLIDGTVLDQVGRDLINGSIQQVDEADGVRQTPFQVLDIDEAVDGFCHQVCGFPVNDRRAAVRTPEAEMCLLREAFRLTHCPP